MPDESVVVPVDNPFTKTVAPGKGSPDLRSLTVINISFCAWHLNVNKYAIPIKTIDLIIKSIKEWLISELRKKIKHYWFTNKKEKIKSAWAAAKIFPGRINKKD